MQIHTNLMFKKKIYPSIVKPSGFTLIEFMVASALALVVLLAIGVTYGITSNMRNASENRLAAQQDLRNASELLLRDAQMAGSFGCFNMGNLLNKQMPVSPNSNTGFHSARTGVKLILNDPDYSGISVMSNDDARRVLNAAGFQTTTNSPVLVFTYGQHLAPITNGTGMHIATDVPQELLNTAANNGPIALSSCTRMYIGNGSSLNIDTNRKRITVNNSFGGSLVSNFSSADSFYLPQTTLSQVQSVAYAIGRIPNANTTDALYRFTLNTNGTWSNPQLMASNIQSMQVNQLYAGCDNSSTDVTFSNNRSTLANLPRISMLPAIIEVRLQLTENQKTYGSVTQYLIRANVRGGNVCANQS
ncbi:prepilin-type N-terminal cleavage/methylation domain-containing protein [Eikenella sp. S3360]|uniref:Prepilin-type N-terminal cleavage/methylation domain-containing protein n=1 Tax=Eikenella glucosivorans TaxID=2766967 RepID=A0ABS0N8H4_9NEIS|nr:prepilin-type N-terminal cleavage/methylation domain-containing protein [Eikenella glucosivorans]MBH5328605.1 prepilin-type N-terminal cleavage/methylation domain-containing protein [Eikenella glucosivorans]